mgnify:CR=1 FL=1
MLFRSNARNAASRQPGPSPRKGQLCEDFVRLQEVQEHQETYKSRNRNSSSNSNLREVGPPGRSFT